MAHMSMYDRGLSAQKQAILQIATEGKAAARSGQPVTANPYTGRKGTAWANAHAFTVSTMEIEQLEALVRAKSE